MAICVRHKGSARRVQSPASGSDAACNILGLWRKALPIPGVEVILGPGVEVISAPTGQIQRGTRKSREFFPNRRRPRPRHHGAKPLDRTALDWLGLDPGHISFIVLAHRLIDVGLANMIS